MKLIEREIGDVKLLKLALAMSKIWDLAEKAKKDGASPMLFGHLAGVIADGLNDMAERLNISTETAESVLLEYTVCALLPNYSLDTLKISEPASYDSFGYLFEEVEEE
tara:strand:- start:1258 stop:1581 length:324 start_codon:yes stop_codon:yes gene_type:complete